MYAYSIAAGLSHWGGVRNFLTGGLNLPTRGLKYGFPGIVNAKIVFHFLMGD